MTTQTLPRRDAQSGLPASSPANRQPPIDHVHLARYTLGDRALELEILQLFAGQAPEILQQLRASTDHRSWHAATHTLKGSARAVGAFDLAAAAETAERAGFANADADGQIAAIGEALRETLDYVSRLARAA